MSADLAQDDVLVEARLVAYLEKVTGLYSPELTMSQRFDATLKRRGVDEVLWPEIKALAGKLVQGERGSSIAHQMPSPFFPRPPWLAAQGSLPLPERATERGELMRYFCKKLNGSRLRDGYPKITMSRMGKIFQGIPTTDLYVLKALCSQAPNFSKEFWRLLDPQQCT